MASNLDRIKNYLESMSLAKDTVPIPDADGFEPFCTLCENKKKAENEQMLKKLKLYDLRLTIKMNINSRNLSRLKEVMRFVKKRFQMVYHDMIKVGILHSSKKNRLEFFQFFVELEPESTILFETARKAASSNINSDFLDYLKQKHFQMYLTNGKYNDFVMACKDASLEEIDMHVKQGADVNAQLGFGLVRAVLGGNLPVFQYLLQNGAKPSEFAMFCAIAHQQHEMVETLVHYGMDILHRDGAFITAAIECKVKVVPSCQDISDCFVEDSSMVQTISRILDAKYPHLDKKQVLVHKKSPKFDQLYLLYILMSSSNMNFARFLKVNFFSSVSSLDSAKEWIEAYNLVPFEKEEINDLFLPQDVRDHLSSFFF